MFLCTITDLPITFTVHHEHRQDHTALLTPLDGLGEAPILSGYRSHRRTKTIMYVANKYHPLPGDKHDATAG